MELDNFVKRYPCLYHMAEAGTWPKIKQHGLLSTTAVLDKYGITGDARLDLEQGHRPNKSKVGSNQNYIVLRDQKPMAPERLATALIGGLTPSQWYTWLNGRAFFWAEEHRLFKLLGARAYRNLEHDVLTLDTAMLVNDYEEKIWLCHMNSGNTFPMAFPRDLSIFKRISDYPCRPRTGVPTKEVVEVVVDYEVQNIEKYTLQVRRMKSTNVLQQIQL